MLEYSDKVLTPTVALATTAFGINAQSAYLSILCEDTDVVNALPVTFPRLCGDHSTTQALLGLLHCLIKAHIASGIEAGNQQQCT
jgi:hypothetical protein